MQKSEYYQAIGKRVTNAMKALRLTQHQVLLKCHEHGYEISQSALSKMLTGSSIQILSLAQVCQVLELDIAEVLSLDPETDVHVQRQPQENGDFLITNARNKAFRGYKGKYFLYFYTTKNEDYIHEGTFWLEEDSSTHQCVADIRFKTGEKNEDGKDIEKHYSGPAYYSIPMQTIYVEVTSEDIGEKCYLLFHYDFLAYQNLECRLATVITVSCGTRRLPTMHRMLLTRKELTEDDLYFLCGQLKLNSSEILISENAYREFIRDEKLPPKFYEYFGDKETYSEHFISSVAKISYFSFNESLISDSFLPPMDKMKIICLLRKYSAAARYNKISDKSEEIIYKFLQIKNKDAKEQGEKPNLSTENVK